MLFWTADHPYAKEQFERFEREIARPYGKHGVATVTINEGNTNSKSAIVNADTRLRLGDHRQYAKLIARRDENNDETTKRLTRVSYEYDWLFRRNWYIGATASYERDPIRDLEHRYTLGLIVGRDIFNDDIKFLSKSVDINFGFNFIF